MTTAEKTEKKSTDKRERILEGALKAFAKKGFYNTRVSEIASEAGVADGTIYLYFKNKDDLLISLFEDRMEFLIARMNTELEGIKEPTARLERVIALHCHLAVEEPDLAEFITVELRQSSKFVKEYENPKFHDYLNILEGILEEGRTSGVFRSEARTGLIARSIFGALDEVLLLLTLGHVDEKGADAIVEQITTFIVRGVQA